MKNIILVIFTALCFIYCNSQIKKEIQLQGDLKKENLKGNVQSVLTKKYSVVENFGEIQKEKMLENKLFLYDDSGNITEERIYNKSDKLENVIQFTYNDKGKKTFKRYKESAPNGTSLVEFGYDENGYLVYERSFNQEGELMNMVTVYINNKNGILIAREFLVATTDKNDKVVFNDEGEIKDLQGIIFTTFEYNTNGQVVKEKTIDFLGESTVNYSYNHNGDVIEEDRFNYGEKHIHKLEYTYDSHNNWITRIEYQGIKPITKTERIIKYR